MTHRDDSRLLGREPEFARMSLRPGIGHDFMHEVASTYLQYQTAFEATQADVPSALRVGSRSQPLGRYLRRTLRKLVGKGPNAPEEAIRQYQEEVLPLLIASKDTDAGLQTAIIKRYAQKILNQKSRAKLRKQRKTL